MKKDRRVEECGYCGSMIEWYKGPEMAQSPAMIPGGQWNLSSTQHWGTSIQIHNNWSTAGAVYER